MRQSHRARGYALPLVLAILGVTATALAVLLTVISSSAQVSGDMIKRRKVFYACDGIQRSIVQLGNEYLRSDVSPTPAEMQSSVETAAGGVALPNITPPGFTVDSFTVNFNTTDIRTGPLANGPFEGMNAQQTPVRFELQASFNGSSITCRQNLEATLGQVGLFQFLVFADANVGVSAGSQTTFDGRVHVNGNACMQGFGTGDANDSPRDFDDGPYFFRLTASGNIMHSQDARCEAETPLGQAGNISLPNGDPSLPAVVFADLLNSADSGCTSCEVAGEDWQAYALRRWGGNVQDVAHQVPNLTFPISGAAPTQLGFNARVQDGASVQAEHTDSNAGSGRFLVDPPQPGDTIDVHLQRYACKADIRIIDGVWYKRPLAPADGCGYPGIAIWSDHAEVTGIVGETSQAELDVALGWTGTPPSGYSFYERQNFGITDLADDTNGVISYGSLINQNPGASATWAPGHYVDGSLSLDAANCHGAGANGFFDATATTGVSCHAAALLNATRSGFRDGHAELTSFTNGANRSRVLPVNFDVAAFQRALADTGAGELGDALSDRTFNGIVYVTSRWPGWDNGFPDGEAAQYPDQGVNNGGADVTVDLALTSAGQQNDRIPHTLCTQVSQQLAAVPTTMSSPLCGEESENGHPNALRIYNARNVNFAGSGTPAIAAGQVAEGLTIMTNLPFYVLGDANESSAARDPAANQTGAPAPWTPVAFGGDQAHLLSNNWDDANAPWGTSATTNIAGRCPVATTYNIAMLTGNTRSENGNYDGGLINLPRFLEDWRGDVCSGGQIPAIFTGSFVIAHAPVYAKHVRAGPGDAYTRPIRDWAFDSHFDLINNQPPGTPVFDVGAIRRWSRW